MRRNAALVPSIISAIAITAVLATGGCSLFSSDDEEEAAAAEQADPEARIEPIEAVRHIEIGRTRNGYVISAIGTAPGLGYGAPELRARREGKPGTDGFIDLDFVAQAPDAGFNLGEGSVIAREVRADLLVPEQYFRGAAGVRIHGVSGGLRMLF